MKWVNTKLAIYTAFIRLAGLISQALLEDKLDDDIAVDDRD
jgi:hypothetical protein